MRWILYAVVIIYLPVGSSSSHHLSFISSVNPSLFSTYLHKQVSTGEVKTIGPTRLYTATSASPDGRYLLVSWCAAELGCLWCH